MLHSSSKILSANMARSPVGSCLCLLAWTLARGFTQKLLGPRWQGADKGVFGLLLGGRMFSVLVADHDKTLPEIFFYLSLLRRCAAGTDNSRVNFRNVRLLLTTRSYLPFLCTFFIYTRSQIRNNGMLEIRSLIEQERPSLHQATIWSNSWSREQSVFRDEPNQCALTQSTITTVVTHVSCLSPCSLTQNRSGASL